MTGTAQDHYLVTGATGFQGGAVARALARDGRRVRGLSREAGAAVPGVTMTAGDLADRQDVLRAFDGITHASVVFPQAFDPQTVLAFARNVAEAARDAGVRRLVFNTNIPIPAEQTSHAPFETRREAEAVLRQSGVSMVVLRPTLYLDNLFSPWSGPAIVNDGVLAYPLALDQRVAWLSHADLAAATVAALSREGLGGETLHLGGRQSVTGVELAAAFSAVLGRTVTYLPLSVDAFHAGLEQALGPDVAAAVAGVYRYAAGGSGRTMFDVDPAPAARRLGVEPRPLAEWIGEQQWEQWRAGAGRESVAH